MFYPISVVGAQLIVEHSEIHGKGLFAKNAVHSLETICEERLEAANWTPGKVMLFDGPLRWVNHSNNPNAILTQRLLAKSTEALLELVALREILPGEEITYDYGAFGHQGEAVRCLCGQADCPGYFHLRLEFGEVH